jgi:hypothetical protein
MIARFKKIKRNIERNKHHNNEKLTVKYPTVVQKILKKDWA